MTKIEKLRQQREVPYEPDRLLAYFLSSKFTDNDRLMIAELKETEYKKGFQNALKLNLNK